MSRLTIGTLLVLTAAVVIAAVMRPGPRDLALNGTHLGTASEPLEFALTADTGPVALSDFRGRAAVVFFGYTSCPDICPPTMARLARAMEILGDRAEDVQVLLVTVDPEVDTPDRLGAYARSFHPTFMGLRGSADEIREVAGLFGAFAGDAPTAGHGSAEPHGARLIGHSSHLFGVDPEGRYRVLWNADHTAEELASDLRDLLRD